MDNCWISCQVMADMKKVYDDLIIINLYATMFYGELKLRKGLAWLCCLAWYSISATIAKKSLFTRPNINNDDFLLEYDNAKLRLIMLCGNALF